MERENLKLDIPQSDTLMKRAVRWATIAARETGEEPSEHLGEAWMLAERAVSNNEAVDILISKQRPQLIDPQLIDPNLVDAEIEMADDVFYYSANKQAKEVVERVLATLGPREHRIIALFYGISCDEHTQKEVAQVIGLSSGRIREIRVRCFHHLKHPSRARFLLCCI